MSGRFSRIGYALPFRASGQGKLNGIRRLQQSLLMAFFVLSGFMVSAQTSVVKGTVTNDKAEPLSAVTVNLKGTNQSVVTNDQGEYTIAVPNGKGTLVFSYAGFVTIEQEIKGESTFNVTMAPQSAALNTVVVVGYGTARRKDLTGAVSSVKAERMENERPQSLQDILRGNVAGLQVGLNSNAKGSPDMELRGDNSLKTSSSPLIVLDGVIYPGVLSDINPNDIATIDILKDASSSAIFGARSANGIIQITTKRGEGSGKPTINFNTSIGMAQPTRIQKVYGPEGFINWRSDVITSMNRYNPAVSQKLYIYQNPDNLPAGVTLDMWRDGNNGDVTDIFLTRLGLNTLEQKNYKEGKSFDWEDAVYQNGLRQDYNVSLSGRQKAFTYYWSVGYNNNEGVVVGDQFKTLRSRLNFDVKITDWLNMGTNLQFSNRDESNIPATWGDVYRASPYGSYYKDDGVSLRLSPTDDLVGSKNPLYDRAFQNRLIDFVTVLGTAYANVKLPLGISYQINFSPRMEWYRNFNHRSSQHEEWKAFGGEVVRQNQNIYSWQLDNLFKWSKTIANDHKVDATFLINAEKYQSWFSSLGTQGFSPTDVLGYGNVSAGSSASNVINANDEYSTGDALMGRLFYSFKDRYMLTVSLRRDGYSAFGLENPRAVFPAIALGWVFTDEKFAKNDILTYGKLRASWGENGNREIGRYDALSNMTIGKYAYYTLNGQAYQSNTLTVSRMSNSGLKWEKSRAINFGLDFGILNGLLDGSIEVYKMSTLDLLVDRKLPDVVGFTSVTANLGEVENRGLEITLNARVIDHSNFRWRASANVTLNRNKIVHLYGDMVDVLDGNGNKVGEREGDDITNKWFIGESIDRVWGPVVLGVWQTGQESEAAKFNQFPGDFRIKDHDNSGSINQLDYEFQGYTEPRVRWNLRNEFTIFKQLYFSFNIYSYWGHSKVYNEAKNSNGFPERNNSYVTPYWTPENPTNEYSRIRSSAGGIDFNVYRNASFIRLDNITLAYSVPTDFLRRITLSNFKVFASIRNTALWAPNWPKNFWDPENAGPTQRIYTFGIDFSL